MKWSVEYKDVDGYKCPENFNTEYDLTTKNCEICSQPKHYKPCSYINAQACYGWGHKIIGPMSCKGYVEYQKDRKEFL